MASGEYGVNSGIGRSAKVVRRLLGLPDRSVTISDDVIGATHAVDPTTLVTKICDERLRFLRSLRTWPIFGAGWSRRVAEVKVAALAMAVKEHHDM
jgi:lysozyme family protein